MTQKSYKKAGQQIAEFIEEFNRSLLFEKPTLTNNEREKLEKNLTNLEIHQSIPDDKPMTQSNPLVTCDIEKVVYELINDRPVVFDYSRHYGIVVTLYPDDSRREWEGSPEDQFIDELFETVNHFRALKQAVPKGNWDMQGGDEKIIHALCQLATLEKYL